MRGYLPLLCITLVLGSCKPKPSEQPPPADDASATHDTASKGGQAQEAPKAKAGATAPDEDQGKEEETDTCLNEDVDKDKLPYWSHILSACEKPYGGFPRWTSTI